MVCRSHWHDGTFLAILSTRRLSDSREGTLFQSISCSLIHKRITRGPHCACTTPPSYFQGSHIPNRHFSLPSLHCLFSPSIDMSTTAIYATQLRAGNHQHSQSRDPATLSSSSLSATLVNQVTGAAINERSSVKLKIVRGKSNIVNSEVVNAEGQSLYSISSNSKRTTVVACKDNVEVAVVEWDRSSPRMVFHQKKMKCKEWLVLAGPETEYRRIFFVAAILILARSRILTHGESQLIWMIKSSTSGYVCILHYRNLSWGTDRRALANPRQPTRSLRRTMAN